MALPSTRINLRDHCLRKLGHPVIEINVATEQLEDCIDEALAKYKLHHFDGTEKKYVAHTTTPTDISNKYFTVAPEINSVIRLLPFAGNALSGWIFSEEYQFRLSDFAGMSLRAGEGILDYVIQRQYWNLISDVFGRYKTVHFNKVQNRIFVETAWGKDIQEGTIIVYECMAEIDEESFPEVFSDPWLILYTTTLFKEIWGTNLKKFSGVQLPGGITLNGNIIYQEAIKEKEELDRKLMTDFSPPLDMLIG